MEEKTKKYTIPKKAKSKVWEVFRVEIDHTGQTNTFYAYCKECNIEKHSFCGSASNLREYIQHKHPDKFKELFITSKTKNKPSNQQTNIPFTGY